MSEEPFQLGDYSQFGLAAAEAALFSAWEALEKLHGDLVAGEWSFTHTTGYDGPPVSLALPVREAPWIFTDFPPFLEGLLPEGPQLESILRKHKIDRGDCFRQLMVVGQDVVGSLTAEEWPAEEGGAE